MAGAVIGGINVTDIYEDIQALIEFLKGSRPETIDVLLDVLKNMPRVYKQISTFQNSETKVLTMDYKLACVLLSLRCMITAHRVWRLFY